MIYALILVAFFLLYKKLGEIGEKGRDLETPPEPPSEITWQDSSLSNCKLMIIGGYEFTVLGFSFGWIDHSLGTIPLPDLVGKLFQILGAAGQINVASGTQSTTVKFSITNTKLSIQWRSFEYTGGPGMDFGPPGFEGAPGYQFHSEGSGAFYITAKQVKEGVQKMSGLAAQLISENGYEVFRWDHVHLRLKLFTS